MWFTFTNGPKNVIRIQNIARRDKEILLLVVNNNEVSIFNILVHNNNLFLPYGLGSKMFDERQNKGLRVLLNSYPIFIFSLEKKNYSRYHFLVEMFWILNFGFQSWLMFRNEINKN